MRQVVLVVVLVGAAFLGGAFVNGPGLRWVQTQLLGSMGLGEENEIAAVDLNMGAGGPGANTGSVRPAGEVAGGPMAPVPAIVADAGATRPGSSDVRPFRGDGLGSNGDRRPPAASPSPSPPRSRGSSRLPSSQTAASSTSAAADDARDGNVPPPLPANLTDPASPQAPRDPEVTLATAASAPAPSPPVGRTPSGREVPSALMDSLAALMPSPAPAPPDGPQPSAPAPAPAPSPRPLPAPAPAKPGDDDWAMLARKMQALGVSRFTIEGQPGGRVVFSCLIPVAGRQAVAQRFEAEGEDAVQAARAAMRRVALWRAAQPQQQPH